MAIIHYTICGRNVWKFSSVLNYTNILQPVYLNIILHGNFLQCSFFIILILDGNLNHLKERIDI